MNLSFLWKYSVSLLLFNLICCYCLAFTEIKIKQGTRVDDTYMKLTEEGLICFGSIRDEKNNVAQIVRFFEHTVENQSKVKAIQDFVTKNHLMTHSDVLTPESMIKYERRIVFVNLVQMYPLNCHSFKYEVCDEEIDELLTLFNDLVPKEWKEVFWFFTKC